MVYHVAMRLDASSDDEEWRAIAGYEGFYEVSNLGAVRSLPRAVLRTDGQTTHLRGRRLRGCLGKNGYELVSLYFDLRMKKHYVHVLVATAFHARPEDAEVVRHLNGDRRDNRAENVTWGTYTENAADTLAHGMNYQVNKETCRRGHELAPPNLTASMAKHGHRQCLACNRAHGRIRYRKLPPESLQAVSDSYYADIMRSAA